MAFELLRIDAHEKADYSDGAKDTFEAYVNPSELTFSYEMVYTDAKGVGTTNSRRDFTGVKPGDMTLTFFLDGTGANGKPCDVQAKVQEFQTATGYSGDIHRPRYLKVGWGTLEIKNLVLKSASVAYKLFKPDGVPLRAVITANLTEASDDRTREAKAQNKSADLTHVRVVKAGDTLPLLCDQVYGDPGQYLRVARANGLDDLRSLVPGTRLRFPPISK